MKTKYHRLFRICTFYLKILKISYKYLGYLSIVLVAMSCTFDDRQAIDNIPSETSLKKILISSENDTVKLSKIMDTIKQRLVSSKQWEKAADSIIRYHHTFKQNLNTAENNFYLRAKAKRLTAKRKFQAAESLWCMLLEDNQENESSFIRSEVYRGLAEIAGLQGDFKNVIYYSELGQNLDSANEFYFLLNQGYVYFKTSNYSKGLSFFQKALDCTNKEIIPDRNIDLFKKNLALFNIAGIYYDVAGENQNDRELLTIAKKYYDSTQNPKSIFHDDIKLNLAGIEKKLGNTEKAKKELLMLNTILKKESIRKNIYYQLADIYFIENDLDTAEDYCLKAIKNTNLKKDAFWAIDFYFLMAKINDQRNLKNKAHSYAKMAHEFAKINNTLDEKYTNQLFETTTFLYKSFEHKKQQDSALYYSKMSVKYSQRLKNENNKWVLLKNNLISENKKRFDDNLKQIDEKKKRMILLFSFIIAFLLLCFYFYRKNQKKQTRLLVDQLEQLKKQLMLTNFKTNATNTTPIIDKEIIENKVNCKLNQTDWSILTLLVNNPLTTNKELSDKVSKSIAGIRSSLQKMYTIFNIAKGPRDKRILLIIKVVELFNDDY